MALLPATRVEVFECPLPAGTPKVAPVEIGTPFAAGELVRAELLFPDGCAGLVGVRLAVGHAQAVPITAGSWLVGNDETLGYDLAGQINNGAWSVVGYNLDIYQHVVHVRYLIADASSLPGASLQAPATLPLLS